MTNNRKKKDLRDFILVALVIVAALIGCVYAVRNPGRLPYDATLPSADVQALLIEQSKQINAAYLNGDPQKVLALTSSYAFSPEQKNHPGYGRFIVHQRESYRKHKNLKESSEITGYKVISMPSKHIVYLLFFSVNDEMSEKITNHEWPDLSRPDVAVVEFQHSSGRYIQLWTKEGDTWKCFSLPFDLDESMTKDIEKDPIYAMMQWGM